MALMRPVLCCLFCVACFVLPGADVGGAEVRVLSLCCVACSSAGLPFYLSTGLLATRWDVRLQHARLTQLC